MEEGEPHKVLNVGESTSIGFKLVSASSNGAVFEDLNGNLVKIGMNNEITTTFTRHVNNSGVEVISLNEHNQYIANVIINNVQTAIQAIIDTGANFVTISGEIADSLGINYKNDANKLHVTTASENTVGYSIVLNTLQIGSISLSNIDAIVLEGHEPIITLIGMSFLKQLDLQYSGDKLEIKHHSEANNKTTNKAISDHQPLPANTVDPSNNTTSSNTPKPVANTEPASNTQIPQTPQTPPNITSNANPS